MCSYFIVNVIYVQIRISEVMVRKRTNEVMRVTSYWEWNSF